MSSLGSTWLKAGGYRSAAVYFQAICGHQQRILKTPIPAIVKHGIRDCIRSIQRGLGESKLKDAFNGLQLGNMPFSTDEEPFSFDNVAHCRDMALIGLWFMLRESEMASARECDLRLRRYALAYQYTRPTREDGSQKDRLHAAAQPRYTACACGAAPRGTCSALKLTIKGLHNNRCHFSLMKEAARHPRRHSSKRSVG